MGGGETDFAAFAHVMVTSRYGREGLRSSCDPLGSCLEFLIIFALHWFGVVVVRRSRTEGVCR